MATVETRPEVDSEIKPRFSGREFHHVGVRQVLGAFIEKARSLSPRQWLVISILIALLMVGNALQIIAINFWLRRFGSMKPSPFTTFFVSNAVFAAFFLVMLVGYWLTTRPKSARFALQPRAVNLLFWIGFFDAINSWMSIYATIATPEILQSLFTSLSSIYTFIMTKIILKDPRNYCNKWALASFALMIIGVVVASIPDFSDASAGSSSKRWWALIFFLSVPTQSFYNVLQAKYMTDYTFKGSRVEYNALCSHRQRVCAEDGTVKFVMLFGDTFTQLLVSVALLPADALPWWGTSHTVAAAWDNFSDGLSCLFSCDMNGAFALLYSAGFVFVYVGCAYLNHYSATLCSMISQLSSPITAIVLIIVPAWNLNQGSAPWYLSLIAVVLLTVGTIIYSIWEEMSSLDEEQEPSAEAASEVVVGKINDEKTTLLDSYPQSQACA